jgi:hypothetical protein
MFPRLGGFDKALVNAFVQRFDPEYDPRKLETLRCPTPAVEESRDTMQC